LTNTVTKAPSVILGKGLIYKDSWPVQRSKSGVNWVPATPDQIPTNLTLEIGENLSPERFMAAARAFFGYVEELSRTVAPDGQPLRWIVRVREGSALLAVDPSPATPPEVAHAIYARAERGIRHLIERDIGDSGLPEQTLKYLRTLSELTEAGPNKAPPVPIRLWIEKRPISFEPTIASAIREDVRADYNDYGTIEGRLETIQESYGTLQFYIRDTMLRQRVRCYFPEDLLPEVFDKFRKRVEVSGIIHYRKSGTPISIEAELIIGFPGDGELPTAGDVRGILRS
jgi:hypothetical protein